MANNLGIQDFLEGLYREGTNVAPQDEFVKKQAALQEMVNQSQDETQRATEQAGAYSAMGKALDSMSANKMALGPGFKPTALGTNANAEGILNAYQGAKAQGAAGKLKALLQTYQLANQGAQVGQGYDENRINALKAGAGDIAAIAAAGQKVPLSGVNNEPKYWANAEDMASADDKKEATDPSYVEVWSKRLGIKRPATHEEKVMYYYQMQKKGERGLPAGTPPEQKKSNTSLIDKARGVAEGVVGTTPSTAEEYVVMVKPDGSPVKVPKKDVKTRTERDKWTVR